MADLTFSAYFDHMHGDQQLMKEIYLPHMATIRHAATISNAATISMRRLDNTLLKFEKKQILKQLSSLFQPVFYPKCHLMLLDLPQCAAALGIEI